MKRWWIAILLLLSIGLNIGLLAQRVRENERRQARETARHERRSEAEADAREKRIDRLLERMVEKVGVGGGQRQRFVDLHRGFFGRTLNSREQVRRLQRELRENLGSQAPDRSLADRQVEEIAQAQQALEADFVETYFAASALLEKDELAKYRQLVAELRRLRFDRGRRGGESREEWRERRERRESRQERSGPGG